MLLSVAECLHRLVNDLFNKYVTNMISERHTHTCAGINVQELFVRWNNTNMEEYIQYSTVYRTLQYLTYRIRDQRIADAVIDRAAARLISRMASSIVGRASSIAVTPGYGQKEVNYMKRPDV